MKARNDTAGRSAGGALVGGGGLAVDLTAVAGGAVAAALAVALALVSSSNAAEMVLIVSLNVSAITFAKRERVPPPLFTLPLLPILPLPVRTGAGGRPAAPL